MERLNVKVNLKRHKDKCECVKELQISTSNVGGLKQVLTMMYGKEYEIQSFNFKRVKEV